MLRLQVIMDVVEAGYTGQRDQWETRTREVMVGLQDEGRTIQFLYPGSEQRQIQFERSELLEALDALDQARDQR